MKLYADSPGRRNLQLLGDLFVIALCAGSIWLAFLVHGKVAALEDPGRSTTAAATKLGGNLRDAGDLVAKIPLVPDGISDPFQKGADASDDLAKAGRQEVDAVTSLAFWLGIVTGALPIILVLGFLGPPRVRWIQEATWGKRFLDTHDDIDLFALRALVRQPLHKLAQITDDPAGAWRRGDPAVVDAMAILEMRDCGLDPQRRLPAGPRR